MEYDVIEWSPNDIEVLLETKKIMAYLFDLPLRIFRECDIGGGEDYRNVG